MASIDARDSSAQAASPASLATVPSAVMSPPMSPTVEEDPTLYVVVAYMNPRRFDNRLRLFREFEQRMLATPGIVMYVVECAFGQRPFEATSPTNPLHKQVRSNDELWLKERLINIGVRMLPNSWRYVAWIDADVQFMLPNWPAETVHMLQHHPIVQMFSQAVMLGPEGQALSMHQSFVSQFFKHRAVLDKHVIAGSDGEYDNKWYGHPGFAWACTRGAWNAFGGLLDFCILGSGDLHMAFCWVQEGARSLRPGLHQCYVNRVLAFQQRSVRHVKGNLGVVTGVLIHGWHGNRVDRRYAQRMEIAVEEAYNPDTDIRNDWQDVLTFCDDKPRLSRRIAEYFERRNEDANIVLDAGTA
jgi:hypothetical protein